MVEGGCKTKVLLLGGTTEASDLALRLAEHPAFDAMLSLAGRTANPKPAPIATRIGGFGGADGLAAFIAQNAIDVVIDATHPFAAQMSRHAIEACRSSGCPLLAVERPPWTPEPSDHWRSFATAEAAVAALGLTSLRVFCAIGRLSLGALAAHPHHHYVVRVIDAPEKPLGLPNFKMIAARGPFSASDDIALFRQERIDAVLAKNSGGVAAISKIEAARKLCLPVILIARPDIPKRPQVKTTAEAWNWLLDHHDRLAERGE